MFFTFKLHILFPVVGNCFSSRGHEFFEGALNVIVVTHGQVLDEYL